MMYAPGAYECLTALCAYEDTNLSEHFGPTAGLLTKLKGFSLKKFSRVVNCPSESTLKSRLGVVQEAPIAYRNTTQTRDLRGLLNG